MLRRRVSAIGRSALTASALALAWAAAASASHAASWPRYGGDDQLQNAAAASSESANLTAADAGALHVRWHVQLDGGLVGSPLYLDRYIYGRASGMIVAATEAGSVYALDRRDGTLLWRRSFGTVTSNGCGTFGFTSTGVIDVATWRLYVIHANGELYALDLETGATLPGWPVRIITHTRTAHAWGGLTLLPDGRLVVPVSSYCDKADENGVMATGRLVLVDTASAQVAGAWVPAGAAGELAGIWGFGGTSVDPLTGDLWTATGNGVAGQEIVGYSDSVVQLDQSLAVVAWNRPAGVPSGEDTDFGSTPLLFQPPGCPPLAAVYNKNGYAYIWRRDALADPPLWTDKIGSDDQQSPFVGEPTYSPALNMLFVANGRLYGDADPSGVVRADAVFGFAIGADCSIPQDPTWVGSAGAGTQPPALAVNDLLFIAGGNSPYVYVLDARSGESLASFQLDGPGYSGPILAGNEVVVGSYNGELMALTGAQSSTPDTLSSVTLTVRQFLDR